MLNADDLAHKLSDAFKYHTDSGGLPFPPPDMLANYAQGVVAALKAATVSNVPGTISGVCAPGAPLSGGFGAGGIMVVAPGPMIAKTQPGIHPLGAVNYSKENAALCTYLSTGIVVFAPGTITGTCTNTAESPGPLSGGVGANGTLTLLNGAACTAAIVAVLGGLGPLPSAIAHYTALIDYILANAKVAYPSVTGVCPAGGGALVGAATGGIIS